MLDSMSKLRFSGFKLRGTTNGVLKRLSLLFVYVPLFSVYLAPVAGQTNSKMDESYFAERLYPVMKQAQCNLCHIDNGVASETDLDFPGRDASVEQITVFGLSLIDFVDRDDPQQSMLLLMPTNREEHTGGERIKPGSEEENVLVSWINHLANLTDEEIQRAQNELKLAIKVPHSPPTVRRLTHSQYDNTVGDLLGDESQPANSFPKEDFVRGFKNQPEVQGISPLQAEAYAKAAERLAASAFRGGDHQNLIPCEPASANDIHCAQTFIRSFGLKAFRRPLTDNEVEVYSRLFQQEVAREADFLNGARIVVEAMLQSPYFLFQIRSPNRDQAEQFEVASRLSYFLWNTMPDDEMLEAASRGELSDPEQLEARVRKMLEDPRAKASFEQFLSQWMRFDRVLTATRDRRRFRDFNFDVANSMVEETKRLFNYLVWEDHNFMEFFTANYTFLSSDLASIYEMDAPSTEFERVMYPMDSGRGGVLGHGSFLVATSKPAESSPTERGLFIRNHFLGHEVPPPPPGVNTSLPDIVEDKPMTNRQRLQIHLNSEACSTCHLLIDPIGLGFEQYNAVGAFQEKMLLRFRGGRYGRDTTKSVELKVDTSGHIQGIADSAFSTPKELGKILAENEACHKCIVKQLFRYAFGREETENDQPTIDKMLARFQESEFSFRELIVAVSTSELFLQKRN